MTMISEAERIQQNAYDEGYEDGRSAASQSEAGAALGRLLTEGIVKVLGSETAVDVADGMRLALDRRQDDGRVPIPADARRAGHTTWCVEPHDDDVCVGARLEVPLTRQPTGSLAVAAVRDQDNGPCVQLWPLNAGGEAEPGCHWLQPAQVRTLVESLQLVLGQLEAVAR